MRAIRALLAALILLLAGCGGEEPAPPASTTGPTGASGPTGATGATGSDSESGGALEASDQLMIEETVENWLSEGDCELMTDDFLEAQTFEADPQAACRLFRAQYETSDYSTDSVTASEFEGDGSEATVTITIEGGISAVYTLIDKGEGWQIDSVDL